ncbi:murein biosynthesis integral membrane protein MurJ [Moorella sp. E306M]|uniref:murein biosynthesis integral membrane protein MurJ n=1 Tax=Moorella sp. E306M TaxID=2572683 RepID=UPI0010FFBF3A|nr:murein biosynthesis integral membrane protein MurJ [Moorella sp. E306M]GEA17226.1 putative lipid II flippase MurJ [Moorella sp. E306M]
MAGPLGKQTVARAASVVMAATVLSKLLGFGREAALAAVFGASRVTDAYLVATVIPSLLFAIVGAAITTVGIPVLSEYLYREEKRLELASLVWSSFHAIAALLLVICFVAVPFAPWLVRLLAPGFGPDQAALTAELVRVMLPATVFMGLSGWAQGVLNAHKHFLAPAAVGIPYNVILITAIFLSGSFWGIEGVAWATVLAIASQFFIQVPVLRGLGIRYRPVLDLRHPGLTKMAALVLPVLVGVGAGQLNVIVDRILASGLAEGSISALNYAQKVLQIPQGLFAAPLIIVLYPSLAERGAVGDLAGFKERLARGLGALAFLAVPLLVGVIVLRHELVAFLFQRGAFDATDARMTAVALLFYTLGLLFLVWRDYLARAFYALQDTAMPMWTGLASVAVNIGLNLVLVRYLAHGGLALATSIAALVGCALLLVFLRRRLGRLGGRYFLLETARVNVAALVMGAVAWWLNVAAELPFNRLAQYAAGFLGGGLAAFGTLGLRISVLGCAGALVYAGACRLLGVREIFYVLGLVRERMRWLW